MDEKMKENIESLRSDLQNLKSEIYAKGGEEMRMAKERAAEKRKQMDEYIQTHPEKSVLIALGIGVIVGMIISIGRRR